MNSTEEKFRLAKYIGAISRWCDLTGHVPSAIVPMEKTEAEFEAFVRHLETMAQETKPLSPWEF